jgi:hypothetical protein
MTIIEAKNRVEAIVYDETAWKELDFYNKEFQRHHLGALKNLPRVEHTPVSFSFVRSLELNDKMEKYLKSGTKQEFEVAKQSLLFCMIDLINFLGERNLPDVSLSDIFKL